jgi:Flavin-binding monooxygenase-like
MGFLEDSMRWFILNPLGFLYAVLQWLLNKLLSPVPPPPGANLRSPRIAVIGAGLTGVSAASHCIGHGFDTTIFETGDKDSIGGIWTVCDFP